MTGVVVLLLVLLMWVGIPLLLLLGIYWVVRLAVRHGQQDAARPVAPGS